MGDPRLLEDGGERGHVLGSDVVVCDAAKEGQGGNGERVGVSTGADKKANTRGGGALELGDSRLFEDGSERGGALGPDAVVIEAAKHGGGWGGERRGVSMGLWCLLSCQRALTQKQGLGSWFDPRRPTPARAASNYP